METENIKKPKEKKEYVKEKLRQKRKESKKNKHRARLIVRNLPFATTEDNLREHFAKFGEIDEIKLLKKEDGKLTGCGFVQFQLVQKAAKARHHLNEKPFLDRNIECDWAVAKSKYEKEKSKEESVKIKEEPADDGYIEIKTEKDDNTEEVEVAVKSEDDDSDVEEQEKEKDEESEDESDFEEKEEGDDKESVMETNERKPHVVSNDATEGKTIFIKNVPFTATNDDIRSCFTQYGPLYYALVCMDSLTEHSKGTAFVKFRNKEDADYCLSTSGITLMGHNLECHAAVTRDELKNRANDKNDKGARQRDSRNLYLVKEGVVLAGTKAAEGVSATDMAKRLQVEQYKTQMLRNLNMFVARTRLIVHNIPTTWNDAKLRTLFEKHSGPKAEIKEARIMRNMRELDNKGIGMSKGFAFVTFTTHEAALEALRSVNNNPNVITTTKRPIVAFSIENRAKLQAKEKRMHNSRVKNPNCKNYNPNAARSKPNEDQRRGVKRPLEANDDGERNAFSGVAATPGSNNKMRSRFKLRTQAQMHHENLKKEKKKKKFAKKTLQQKQQEFTKQPRQKINKKKLKTTDNFSKLVNNYKEKLLSASTSSPTKKKKWFD